MIKSMLSMLSIVLLSLGLQAQRFVPSTASKSIVKVRVTTNGKSYGICTGFLWKSTTQIVTSLHAMKEGGSITIEYQPGINRTAEISKVFVDADLVLLTLKAGQSAPQGAVAISSFQENVVAREEVIAFGFNGGSVAKQTQELKKGYIDPPENLVRLVQQINQDAVKTMGIPGDEFPIYFLSGSLLPGFSGCPVFNERGELIGIGDGGLERGQMNVSWCIPAKNLLVLDKSTKKDLPDVLKKADLLYSAEVTITIKPETQINTEEEAFVAIQKEAEKKYKSFAGNGFNFFQTKTRTWSEMLETTSDRYNMDLLTEEFYSSGLLIDSSVLAYDLYEDIDRGLIIALPENTDLYYDQNVRGFNVNMDSLEEGHNFMLFYNSWDNYSGNTPMQGIIESLKSGWGSNYYSLQEDKNYAYMHQINETWFQETKLLQTSEPYAVGTFDDGTPMLQVSIVYINVVFNGTNSFYSVANCNLPLDRIELMDAFEKGMNCIDSYEDHWQTCDYFESMIQVLGASHLTTMAY